MVVYKSHIHHLVYLYTIFSGAKKYEYATQLIQRSLTCNNDIHDSLCYFGHIHCDFHFTVTINFIETKRKAVKLYICAGA